MRPIHCPHEESIRDPLRPFHRPLHGTLEEQKNTYKSTPLPRKTYSSSTSKQSILHNIPTYSIHRSKINIHSSSTMHFQIAALTLAAVAAIGTASPLASAAADKPDAALTQLLPRDTVYLTVCIDRDCKGRCQDLAVSRGQCSE